MPIKNEELIIRGLLDIEVDEKKLKPRIERLAAGLQNSFKRTGAFDLDSLIRTPKGAKSGKESKIAKDLKAGPLAGLQALQDELKAYLSTDIEIAVDPKTKKPVMTAEQARLEALREAISKVGAEFKGLKIDPKVLAEAPDRAIESMLRLSSAIDMVMRKSEALAGLKLTKGQFQQLQDLSDPTRSGSELRYMQPKKKLRATATVRTAQEIVAVQNEIAKVLIRQPELREFGLALRTAVAPLAKIVKAVESRNDEIRNEDKERQERQAGTKRRDAKTKAALLRQQKLADEALRLKEREAALSSKPLGQLSNTEFGELARLAKLRRQAALNERSRLVERDGGRFESLESKEALAKFKTADEAYANLLNERERQLAVEAQLVKDQRKAEAVALREKRRDESLRLRQQKIATEAVGLAERERALASKPVGQLSNTEFGELARLLALRRKAALNERQRLVEKDGGGPESEASKEALSRFRKADEAYSTLLKERERQLAVEAQLVKDQRKAEAVALREKRKDESLRLRQQKIATEAAGLAERERALAGKPLGQLSNTEFGEVARLAKLRRQAALNERQRLVEKDAGGPESGASREALARFRTADEAYSNLLKERERQLAVESQLAQARKKADAEALREKRKDESARLRQQKSTDEASRLNQTALRLADKPVGQISNTDFAEISRLAKLNRQAALNERSRLVEKDAGGPESEASKRALVRFKEADAAYTNLRREREKQLAEEADLQRRLKQGLRARTAAEKEQFKAENDAAEKERRQQVKNSNADAARARAARKKNSQTVEEGYREIEKQTERQAELARRQNKSAEAAIKEEEKQGEEAQRRANIREDKQRAQRADTRAQLAPAFGLSSDQKRAEERIRELGRKGITPGKFSETEAKLARGLLSSRIKENEAVRDKLLKSLSPDSEAVKKAEERLVASRALLERFNEQRTAEIAAMRKGADAEKDLTGQRKQSAAEARRIIEDAKYRDLRERYREMKLAGVTPGQMDAGQRALAVDYRKARVKRAGEALAAAAAGPDGPNSAAARNAEAALRRETAALTALLSERDLESKAIRKTEAALSANNKKREGLKQGIADGSEKYRRNLALASPVFEAQNQRVGNFAGLDFERMTAREIGQVKKLMAEQAKLLEQRRQLARTPLAGRTDLTAGQQRAVTALTGALDAQVPVLARLNRVYSDLESPLGQVSRLFRQFFRYALGYGALYQVLNFFTFLTRGVVDLNKEMYSIQAVAGATSREMVSVGAAIRSVALSTKFSINEIATAAKTLVQAGVSVADLPNTLKAAAQFAAGTDSDIQTAADLISTVRNVYTEVSDANIANQLTRAINISKLSAADLRTILSLGAQTAQAFNLSSEQYLAAVTVMRNAGIKASTVATGLRQAMLELFNADTKTIKAFQQRYKELGEDLTEEQVRTRFFAFSKSSNPLVAAVAELKRVGFGGEAQKDLQRVFDIRAVNAIEALVGGFTELEAASSRVTFGAAAAEASDVQMRSLSNSVANLGAAMTTFAASVLEGPVEALETLADKATDAFNQLEKLDLKLRAKGQEGLYGTADSGITGAFLGGMAASRTRAGIGGTAAGAAAGLVVGVAGDLAGQVREAEGEETPVSASLIEAFSTVAFLVATVTSIAGSWKSGAGLTKKAGREASLESGKVGSAVDDFGVIAASGASVVASSGGLRGLWTKLKDGLSMLGRVLFLTPWGRAISIVVGIIGTLAAVSQQLGLWEKLFPPDQKEIADRLRREADSARKQFENSEAAYKELEQVARQYLSSDRPEPGTFASSNQRFKQLVERTARARDNLLGNLSGLSDKDAAEVESILDRYVESSSAQRKADLTRLQEILPQLPSILPSDFDFQINQLAQEMGELKAGTSALISDAANAIVRASETLKVAQPGTPEAVRAQATVSAYQRLKEELALPKNAVGEEAIDLTQVFYGLQQVSAETRARILERFASFVAEDVARVADEQRIGDITAVLDKELAAALAAGETSQGKIELELAALLLSLRLTGNITEEMIVGIREKLDEFQARARAQLAEAEARLAQPEVAPPARQPGGNIFLDALGQRRADKDAREREEAEQRGASARATIGALESMGGNFTGLLEERDAARASAREKAEGELARTLQSLPTADKETADLRVALERSSAAGDKNSERLLEALEALDQGYDAVFRRIIAQGSQVTEYGTDPTVSATRFAQDMQKAFKDAVAIAGSDRARKDKEAQVASLDGLADLDTEERLIQARIRRIQKGSKGMVSEDYPEIATDSPENLYRRLADIQRRKLDIEIGIANREYEDLKNADGRTKETVGARRRLEQLMGQRAALEESAEENILAAQENSERIQVQRRERLADLRKQGISEEIEAAGAEGDLDAFFELIGEMDEINRGLVEQYRRTLTLQNADEVLTDAEMAERERMLRAIGANADELARYIEVFTSIRKRMARAFLEAPEGTGDFARDAKIRRAGGALPIEARVGAADTRLIGARLEVGTAQSNVAARQRALDDAPEGVKGLDLLKLQSDLQVAQNDYAKALEGLADLELERAQMLNTVADEIREAYDTDVLISRLRASEFATERLGEALQDNLVNAMESVVDVILAVVDGTKTLKDGFRELLHEWAMGNLRTLIGNALNNIWQDILTGVGGKTGDGGIGEKLGKLVRGALDKVFSWIGGGGAEGEAGGAAGGGGIGGTIGGVLNKVGGFIFGKPAETTTTAEGGVVGGDPLPGSGGEAGDAASAVTTAAGGLNAAAGALAASGQQGLAGALQLLASAVGLTTAGATSQGAAASLMGAAAALSGAAAALTASAAASAGADAAGTAASFATVMAATGGVIGQSGKVVASYATGGIIKGPGTGTSDSIAGAVKTPNGVRPIRVSNGEGILNKRAVDVLGEDFVHRANRGQVTGFSTGGIVGKAQSGTGKAQPPPALTAMGGGGPAKVEMTTINAVDSPSVLSAALSSSAGRRTFMNFIDANKGSIRTRLGS